jgi:hypothetical protein
MVAILRRAAQVHLRALRRIEPKVRSEIATLRRGGQAADAVRVLRQTSGCDLRQAKANVLHIRDAASRHKCQNTLPAGVLLCSQFMSVNLDW